MGAGATPAGWYPDVERPGGERYWDGSLWTEQRRSASDAAEGFSSPPPDSTPPAYGQQPPPYGQQPPTYGQQPPTYGQQPPTYGQQPPAAGQPPSYGTPAGGGYGQPAYGSPAGYTPYGGAGSGIPRSAMAPWGLGLSIAGLVLSLCCVGFLLSVPGTIMGWLSMKAIERGEKDPSQAGVAKGAFIVGLIGVAIGVIVIVLVAVTGDFSANV